MGVGPRDIYGSGFVDDGGQGYGPHGSSSAADNTNDSLAYEEV